MPATLASLALLTQLLASVLACLHVLLTPGVKMADVVLMEKKAAAARMIQVTSSWVVPSRNIIASVAATPAFTPVTARHPPPVLTARRPSTSSQDQMRERALRKSSNNLAGAQQQPPPPPVPTPPTVPPHSNAKAPRSTRGRQSQPQARLDAHPRNSEATIPFYYECPS